MSKKFAYSQKYCSEYKHIIFFDTFIKKFVFHKEMSSPARKRLQKDLQELQKDPPTGISANPSDSDIFHWTACIFGPEDTPYENGIFKLKLRFSEQFPTEPPKVKFVSEMFHPNIFNKDPYRGSVCLDILKSKWSPVLSISAILVSMRSFLDDPYPYNTGHHRPEGAPNSTAACLFLRDRPAFNKKVKETVEKSLEEAMSD